MHEFSNKLIEISMPLKKKITANTEQIVIRCQKIPVPELNQAKQ